MSKNDHVFQHDQRCSKDHLELQKKDKHIQLKSHMTIHDTCLLTFLSTNSSQSSISFF